MLLRNRNALFKASTQYANIQSLPLFEACRSVLVDGESQYSVAKRTGIDQGQLSKACSRIHDAHIRALTKALHALNDLAPFDELGCYPWAHGQPNALDMRESLREIHSRLTTSAPSV